MRRASLIEKDSVQIATVGDLTNVFESIASNQVAKVKGKVDLSTAFFGLLWKKYKSIRIDPKTHITNRVLGDEEARQAYIIISAESGLSGDIDQRLIETMLRDYDEKTTDIIVLGSHGANQLTQRGIKFVRFFQVPETDRYIDVSPVIHALDPYSQIYIYFEKYVSLGVQEIKRVNLISSIRSMSQVSVDDNEDIMTSEDTIFEPSLSKIAQQMEVTMMTLALSQAILESNLAQAASRFSAMAVAKKRAFEILSDYKLEYHRAKRSESDRSLREIMVSIKKKKQHAGGKA